jgi:Fe-S cluster assembly ATP-binding protein
MLQLENLRVTTAEGKEILPDITLAFESGKTYFLLGKNGSGKTSLSLSLMGHPKYRTVSGKATLDEGDLLSKSPEDRAAAGLFLSLQNVPEIKGVKVAEYLRSILNARLRRTDPEAKPLSPFVARRAIAKECAELGIPEAFLDRELNVGFSGGEKRRLELLQLKLLSPKFVILDEIDSGLDVDAFKSVASSLAACRAPDRTFLVVTHNFALAEYLPPDGVVVLESGRVVKTGGPEIIRQISERGFFE